MNRRGKLIAEQFVEAVGEKVERPPHAAAQIRESRRRDAMRRHMPPDGAERAIGYRIARRALRGPVDIFRRDRTGPHAEPQIVREIRDFASQTPQPGADRRHRGAAQPLQTALPRSLCRIMHDSRLCWSA
jgi:hypothetical protein